MSTTANLGQYDLVAFVNIRNRDQAKAFYQDTLGLRLVSEDGPYAIVFDAHGTMLRLAIAPDSKPIAGTVLGWRVPDIETAVRDLMRAGVQFERYGFMEQDELGIWTTPGGARVAWFKDPDGNLLSVSYHPEAADQGFK